MQAAILLTEPYRSWLMKTRDRILETSLALFNQEGEQNVTTVDIANEMGISPGNLYYHFKGKDAILSALFERFYQDFMALLDAPIDEQLALQDYWFYIYVVLEEMHKFRFFYLNIIDLIQRDRNIAKRFKRLLDKKRSTIIEVCTQLEEHSIIRAGSAAHAQIADTITMALVYHFSYQALIHDEADFNTLMHGGVYHVMSIIAPYFVDQQADFYLAIQ